MTQKGGRKESYGGTGEQRERKQRKKERKSSEVLTSLFIRHLQGPRVEEVGKGGRKRQDRL